jgi:hypothetical protein
MQTNIGASNRGKTRRRLSGGKNLSWRKRRARTKAQETWNWTEYKALSQELMSCPATDPQDAGYRRMFYVRYADDFLRTLASKRQSTLCKVARSLKAGPNRYVIDFERKDGRISQYVLVSSTKQLRKRAITYTDPDLVPNAWQFRRRTELGRRLRRNACEWCGSTDSSIEVHHVRNLIHPKGSKLWERVMTQKRRKSLVLCKSCHENLHADRLVQHDC